MRNNDGLVINVASSVFVIDGFLNFDNHIFLKLAKFCPWARFFVPIKNREFFDAYRNANKIADLRIHDCRKPLPVEKGSVDHILCSHFLEHVFPKEAENILNGFHKVLKDSGTLHIIVPDLGLLIEKYNLSDSATAADEFMLKTLLSHAEVPSLKYRLLDFFGSSGFSHKWMYDRSSLYNLVKKCGFEHLRDDYLVPSATYRQRDGSVHLFLKKLA